MWELFPNALTHRCLLFFFPTTDGNLVDSMKNFISKLGEGNLAVSYRLPWEAVTAVLLISVPWWENFMDANCNRLHQFAENMKRVCDK